MRTLVLVGIFIFNTVNAQNAVKKTYVYKKMPAQQVNLKSFVFTPIVAPIRYELAGLKNFNNGLKKMKTEITADHNGDFLPDLSLSWKIKNLIFFVMAENLTDAKWNRVQFNKAAELQFETVYGSETQFIPSTQLFISFGINLSF